MTLKNNSKGYQKSIYHITQYFLFRGLPDKWISEYEAKKTLAYSDDLASVLYAETGT